MAAVNSMSSGSRLELAALRPRAVLMCGTVGGESSGVALQLRGAGEVAVSCQDPALLADLLATLHAAGTGETNTTASIDVLDSSPCQDLASSPPLGSDCFLTDTPDTPTHTEQDQGSESANNNNNNNLTSANNNNRFASKKIRPKATSPSRQGPQQCQVCNKVFGNASALAKHKLTHSDERKYGCPVCAKAFKRQDHLNGHMLTHRNKKPYECRAEGCGKSYCDARSLRRHAENHHASQGSKNGSSSSTSPSSHTNGGCIQFAAGAANGSTSEGNNKDPSCSPDSGKGSTPSPPSYKVSKAGDSSPNRRPSPGSGTSPSATSSVASNKTSANTIITNGISSSSSAKHSVSGNCKHQSASHASKVTPGAVGQGKVGVSIMSSGTVGGQLKSKAVGQIGKVNGYQGSGNTSQVLQQNGQSGQSSPTEQKLQEKASSAPAPPSPTKILTLQKPPRTWNIQAQQNQQKSNIVRGPPLIPPHRPPAEPRPVECNLCHRKFKNVPALNGHMRLHGGYFKKEAESKKLEKKEASGPPLQTASVSVRALIEEKIISRRAAPPATSNSEPQSPVAMSSPSIGTSLTSFVTPALPATIASPATVATTTTTVTQEFATPTKILPASQQQKDGTLIELLKRGSKVAVKRSASDPGQQSSGPVLSFRSAEFALSSMSFQQDDGEYFSPTLQPDVYHVQDPAILLQSSSDTLQFSTASEQLDDLASLDDYATVTASLQDGSTIQYPVNQQLQAVLDSPLPEGLAEFSTYHSTVTENNSSSKDVLGFQKEYIMYANSPHVGLSAPSPLPSPLKYHDSPSFTYPTPPASHEAQSPSLSQGTVQSVPILSPSTSNVHSSDNFPDNPMTSREVDEVRNSSSPLSAAFFTTTMSSAEEVEEALEEVLPGESIVHGDALDMYTLGDPSPPPQSPMSVTPLSSPLPSQQTGVTQATTNQTLTPTTNMSFQRQTIHTFQSQMMSNSEDPLLSSSPKDFGFKKKFDFGGYQSYKIISHGPIDVNTPNITGILVEANGEYKLIQAASNQLPVSWLTGATHQIVPKESLTSIQCLKQGMISKPAHLIANVQNIQSQEQASQTIIETMATSKTDEEQRTITLATTGKRDFSTKSEPPDSPHYIHQKRSRSDASNCYTGNHHQSRLRSCSHEYYTPPPILDPARAAPGLYAEISTSCDSNCCNHQEAAGFPSDPADDRKTPRINIGSQFQAAVSDLCSDNVKYDREPNYEHLLWDPGINDALDDSEVRMFMELAMCAAMPVGGHTREYALQVLGRCRGDTHAATLQLMASTGQDGGSDDEDKSTGENVAGYTQRWSPDEVEAFLNGLREYDKNFLRISKQIGTKSSKQCVQFYYFWKKITKDYKTLYLRSWTLDGMAEHTSPKNSWRWLSKGGLGRPPSTPPGTPASESGDEFPCKLCGKVFNKVKSRSAHMKSHRPITDAESKRPRAEKSDSKLLGLEERQHRQQASDSPLDNNHSRHPPQAITTV